MIVALYGTIWLALSLFVAGEYGKRLPAASGSSSHPLRQASGIGAALAAVHIVLALIIRDDWSHAVAWATTAERTKALVGVGSGAGLIANYVFVAVWILDVVRWQTRHTAFRVFALVMIASATVVFAAGPQRWAGVALSAALLWAWRPLVSSTR